MWDMSPPQGLHARFLPSRAHVWIERSTSGAGIPSKSGRSPGDRLTDCRERARVTSCPPIVNVAVRGGRHDVRIDFDLHRRRAVARVMRALIGAALAFAMAAILTAPAYAQDAKPDPKLVQRGQQVYAEQKCMMCHSVAGKGNKAGPLDDVGSRLTADELRLWLTEPAEMVKKTKPKRTAIKHPTKLPKEDLDALIVYMRTLRK
jgi:cytochrome c2